MVDVRTSDMLKRELEIQGLQEYFWTDSKVVFGYINNEARRFHVFGANRIQRIKQSTDPEQWRYVTSEENPGDHVPEVSHQNSSCLPTSSQVQTFFGKKNFPKDKSRGESS